VLFRRSIRHRRSLRQLGQFSATLAVAALLLGICGFTGLRGIEDWSASERATIRSLWIGSLGALPADPSNHYADDPAAIEIGKSFFFDRRLSGNGLLACGDCHEPGRVFQDGTPLGHGAGTTARRTMPIAGTAYSPWLFWDGRADSQWAQALGPLESAVEHAGTRALYARVVAQEYRRQYQTVFGALPDLASIPKAGGPLGTAVERASWASLTPAMQDSITRVFVNIGKAIAAFERRIEYHDSRFDRYAARIAGGATIDTAAELSPKERTGLRLFIGKGNCVSCHSGPLLTDNQFHNVGVAGTVDNAPDSGRKAGLDQLFANEFNCLGLYSDAKPADCALTKINPATLNGVQAFRTPSLRALTRRAPYGHTGEFATLAAVLDHHNRAPTGTAGSTELKPLGLTKQELDAIEAFLRTLDSRAVVEMAAPLFSGPR
jgi:cytochrome c peroxidase